MSPFTLFLGRIVGLVGVEISAELVREFAGQTIQFPITDHYSTDRLVSDAPARQQAVRTNEPSPFAHQHLSDGASKSVEATLPVNARQLAHASQALQQYAELLEQARLSVRAAIEALRSDS